MVILIDAYNVLKHMYGAQLGGRHKDQFIARLNRYVKRKSHIIYVVFDGGTSAYPIQYKQGAITVLYAGYGKSADDILIELMQKSWAFDGILVSNDRALRAHARPFQIDCLAVTLFYDIIFEEADQEPKKKVLGDSIKKLNTAQSSPELDALLMGDASNVFTKDEIANTYTVSEHKSKEQKRYYVKLKRL